MRVPPALVALLPPTSVRSGDSSLPASSAWHVLPVHFGPATLVGQHWVLDCPEDKGIATPLPSRVSESALCPASKPAMPAPCEFMGFLSVALSLFIKRGTWQVYLLIQEIS